MSTKLTWKERIKRARAKGKFSRSAKYVSGKWPSCAVGERVPALADENSFVGAVFDHLGSVGDKMDQLGMDFYYAVQADDVKEAASLYKQINAVKLPEEKS